MKKEINILFVDDHGVILKGLISILTNTEKYTFNITTKLNCDDAYTAIKIANRASPYHIVFADLSFSKQDTNIKSGEEFVKKLNEDFPNIKKGVITGHTETNRIYNVIQNVKPSSYLLKDDLNTSELLLAIDKMLKGDIYYTHLVHQKVLKRNIVQISMDDVAIQILNELPKHTKIKNMVGFIKRDNGKPLQLRSIESKLSEIRLQLDAKNNTDLVLKAKELGIID